MKRAIRSSDGLPEILFLLHCRTTLTATSLETAQRLPTFEVVVIFRSIEPLILYRFIVRILSQYQKYSPS